MMVPAYHAVGMESQRTQQQQQQQQQQDVDWQDIEVHAQLLSSEHGQRDSLAGTAKESTMFAFMHTEYCIMAYTLLLFLACLLALMPGRTVGGWAFLFPNPVVHVSTSFPLEQSVYLGGCMISLIGLLGMFAFRSATQRLLDQRPERRPVSGSEAFLEVMRVRRRSASAVLLYFVAGTLRCALFVPVTVMALVGQNTCGFYVHALSTLSLRSSSALSATSPVWCTLSDLGVLGVATSFMLLDVYMTLGVFV